MRTVSRQSSSKYPIKREKTTQLQNEDAESRNLFCFCETLVTLFLQNTSEPVHPVPVELNRTIPSSSQLSPGPRMCLQCHKQPNNSWALGGDTGARHCPRCEQSLVGKGMKTQVQAAAQQQGTEQHRRGF